MDTIGHNKVSEIGEKLLREALVDAGKVDKKDKDTFRLGAFYLGNWLTDISQVYDPIALANGADQAKASVDIVHDFIKKGALGVAATAKYIPLVEHEDVRKDVVEAFDSMKAELYASIDLVTGQGDLHANDLHNTLRDLARFMGYFKFVHPVTNENAAGVESGKMHFHSYMKVVDKAFTQYYPHEHLDRPEILPPSPTQGAQYESDIATGTRSKHNQQTLAPDLYAYLRDHIEVTAGLFADLDLNWAANTLSKGDNQVSDNQIEFNLNLAKLGHGMHQVEDFFAHSNFVEHAAYSLGEDYWKGWWNSHVSWYDRDIFLKRLKMVEHPGWSQDKQGKEFDEKNVVTGYYDIVDTLHSLTHVAEKWLADIESPDFIPGGIFIDITGTIAGAEKSPGDYQKAAARLLEDVLEFIDDPQKGLEEAKTDVAKAIKKKEDEIWDYVEETREKIINPKKTVNVVFDTLLKDAPIPNVIKDNFSELVAEMSRVRAIAGLGISLYKALSIFREFIGGPKKWIKKFIKDTVLHKAFEMLINYVKDEIAEALGAERIGCHTLLGKDHHDSVMQEYSTACAQAMHWYIMDTMTRWAKQDNKLTVSRTAIIGGTPTGINRIDEHPYIDWLELLEFYFRHPGQGQIVTKTEVIARKIQHITKRDDSLLTLTELYRPTAINPSDFTWQKIAKATWDTSEPYRINEILKDTGQGYLVSDKTNYAFKPGVLVIIPEQRITRRISGAVAPDNAWWRPIMDNQKWEVIKKRKNYKLKGYGGEYVDIEYHSPLTITKKEVTAFVKEILHPESGKIAVLKQKYQVPE